MARSDYHGCRPKCGVCHPEKKWKNRLSRKARLRHRDAKKLMNERRNHDHD